MNVLENAFIQRYVEESVDTLKMIVPNLPDKYLKNFVQRQVLKRVVDQPVQIKNTYTELDKQISMLSLMHFIEKEKPIITGNGSFYIHHEEQVAPANDMLINFRTRRTEMKNEMFKCKQAGDDLGYIRNNLGQNNEKIKMNSYYGAMGQSSSFQYNVSCAGAITSQGRSVITTTMWFNETFLGSNIVFDTLDDILHYIKLILEEENHLDLYTWIDYVPTDGDIMKRFVSHYEGKEDPKLVMGAISQILKYASETQKVKLYFKNNLIELLDKNSKIQELVTHNILGNDVIYPEDVYDTNKDGTKKLDESGNPKILHHAGDTVEWLDPNKVPKELAPQLDQLWELLEEFVYMKKFIMYDKVDKYIYHKRKVVMYSDTDSVFIYMGFWVFKVLEYMRGLGLNQISLKELEGEKSFVLKIINVLTRMIYIGIHKTYDTLASNVNITEPYRKYINIKNEFLMDRYVGFPNIKKNYINRVIVQEGNILNKPDIDAKGGNLNAKSKNAIVTKRVKQITEKVTMDGDKILPEELLKEIYQFRDDIIQSLCAGETTYLSPVKVKSPEDYTNPYTQFKYLAVEAYRIGADDQSVDLPGAFNIVDVNMAKLSSLDWLEKNFPEVYERLKKDYYGNKNLGKGGIKYIALPMRLEKIPEWVMHYINADDICRKHLNPLFALLPSLGIKQDTVKSDTYYSTVLCL